MLPVQIDITSVFDPTRAALYRVGTVQDITERKRAEAMAAELHALDARLRQILDETPIAMVLRTVDDPRYVWVNATMCRMLEYSADDLTGRRLDELTAWLDDNCGADCWAMTPAGLRGVLNDAVSVYFCDAALAGGFVARWCRGDKAAAVAGAFQIRVDAPRARRGAPLHRTPGAGGGRDGA